ncbi:MAG: hypothetical protein R3E42_13825 [Burkholderiaceae bacterium]
MQTRFLHQQPFKEPLHVNSITWFEIPVTDLDRAMAVYAAVTGRTLTAHGLYGGGATRRRSFDTTDEADLKGALVKGNHAIPSARVRWCISTLGSRS